MTSHPVSFFPDEDQATGCEESWPLQAAREHLCKLPVILGQQYVLFQAEKDEGYDGHIKWENTPTMQQTMCAFRKAVHEKHAETVTETLESLGAAASEAQLDHISSLILDGTVEPLKEALLSSICIGSRPLTEFILCLFYEHPHEERSGCTESDAFPPHMTPLILACINNNFALVECLLLRGHYIEFPHHRRCEARPRVL